MSARWVVLLCGEVPEVFGLYGSEQGAERAAARWNAAHPGDPAGGAEVRPLLPARELPRAD